jgi:hypothetical protein
VAELILHFELPEGADVATAARQVQQHLSASPDVAVAAVDTDQATRFITGVEFLAAITLAGKVAGSITAIVAALEKLQQLVRTASKNAGVQRVMVDIGLRSVPLDAMTDADKKELAAEAVN